MDDVELGKATVVAAEAGVEWEAPKNHYGKCLYSFESVPIKSSGVTTVTVVSFYEELVVFQEESTLLCYPKYYSQKIIPKYQFKDAHISNKHPLHWVALGFVCILGGSFALSNEEMQTLGIAIIVCGFLMFLYPFVQKCCGCTYYTVTFDVVVEKPEGWSRLIVEYIDFWLNMIGYGSKPSSISINTATKPNVAVLMDYVFGSLTADMTEMHLMHHLISADLSYAVKPKKLSDLHNPEDANRVLDVPQYDDSGENEKTETEELVTTLTNIHSTKFGKVLYKLASAVEGSIYKERTIVTFYEQVVLFQEERQLLCWPMWFRQYTVPKYKFNSMTTERTNPKLYLLLGLLFFFAGCGMCADNMVPGGVVLILLSIPVLIWPCFVSTYEIVFHIEHFKESGLLKKIRSLFFFIFKQTSTTIAIKTQLKPDSDTMMEYVFGPLRDEMNAVHSLNHLLHDDMTKILAPRSLSAFHEPHFLVEK